MEQDGRLEFSDVVAFLDFNHHQIANFYTLTTEAGHSVTLTGKHLIHVMSHNTTPESANSSSTRLSFASDIPRLVFAEDVAIGQYILFAKHEFSNSAETIPQRLLSSESTSSSRNFPETRDNFKTDVISWGELTPEKIVSVQMRPLKGVYAPLTVSGTVVVDGVVASCYAFLKDAQLAHASFAPLRAYHMTQTIFSDWLRNVFVYLDWMYFLPCVNYVPENETVTYNHQIGAHWYARLLYNFAVNIVGIDIYISL